MAKKEEFRPEDVHYGEHNVKTSAQNPVYAAIFNQAAIPDDTKAEFRVIERHQLHEFPNHPYKVIVDDEMADLRDSIIENGVLQPLIVAPRNEGGYTILAGHRRNKACELAHISTVPVLIMKGLSDAQATMIMVDSNKQREIILPSERAFAYQMKMEALNHNGKSTLGTECPRLTSRSQLAQEENIGERMISNYIRLTHLIPQLLDLVDNDALGKSPSMALKPAVEISHLNPNEQQFFYETIKTLGKTPSVQQAKQIKGLSKSGTLTQTRVMEILIIDKPNQRETVRLDYDRIGKYFKENYTPREFEAKIFEKLDSMSRIREAVEKHVKGKTLSDEQLATLIDNLLSEYARSHPIRQNDDRSL